MKKTFNAIVIGIILALSIIFVVQLIWLYRFYRSIEIETEKTILTILEDTDWEEIVDRTEKERMKNKEDKSSVSLDFNYSNNDETDEAETNDKDSIDNNNDFENTKELLSLFGSMKQNILAAMHQAVDPVIPPDLHVLDSIASQLLQKKDLKVNLVFTEYYKLGSDSLLSSSLPEISEKEKNLLHCISYSTVLPEKLTKTVEGEKVAHDNNDNYEYRFYFEPLYTAILYQMGGILITTLLILVILIFAFWYLLRTVFAMKTLEEIKDDFTNNMTHELKTPIAVAYSATDVLLNYNKDNNTIKTEKYLNICKEQLDRLTQLVENILSLNLERRKTLVMDKSLFQLKPIVQTIAEQHKLKYKKPLNITIDIEPTELTVTADKTHLTNIISNLIDNAAKYSGEWCKINIFAEKQKNNMILIRIQDNGMGIPSDKLDYIFDKFYRVPTGNVHNRKGYGLGLFYVKTIVEKHGGKISVNSKLNKGTEFSILIPQDE